MGHEDITDVSDLNESGLYRKLRAGSFGDFYFCTNTDLTLPWNQQGVQPHPSKSRGSQVVEYLSGD